MDKELVEKIAIMCHEVNRNWCQINGDFSQPTWTDAPDWQKESARNGVIFHLENPDAGPEASHNSWLAEKLATGWSYGDVKDPTKKTHPCMVEFEDLPEHQQAKDRLFRETVHAILGTEPKTKPLPVSGYVSQGSEKVRLVNINKQLEELVLDQLDSLFTEPVSDADRRWLHIARTDLERGFMAMNRAIFQPQRTELKEPSSRYLTEINTTDL